MALKHLLNDEPEPCSTRDPFSSWDELGVGQEPLPSLPDQAWEQTIHELDLFGSYNGQHELTQHPTELNSGYELPQFTDEQIEQWITGEMYPQMMETQTCQAESHVCYGTIMRISVKLIGNMLELDQILSSSPQGPIPGYTQMKLIKQEKSFFIAFLDGTVLGEVNAQLETALTCINEQQYELDFEVFTPIKATRETIGRATKEKDAIARVQINVYGPPSSADGVGKEFSQENLYLQYPVYCRNGVLYDNPHVLTIHGVQASDSRPVQQYEETRTEKTTSLVIEAAVTEVYSSLTRGQTLRGLEGDERLKTPLLLHQKKALDFMMQRENGPIPDRYLLWKLAEKDGMPCYQHCVTNTITRIEQTETGGGILADEMGMGKSLSILSLILRTLDISHHWATGNDTETQDLNKSWKSRPRARGTLIVASSDIMINEWFQELELHFHESTLNSLVTIKYHGQQRTTIQDKLCNADIVITTYHTLASKNSSSRPALSDIEWYRLVLDEAHVIRRQSTRLNRAVTEIAARSRWCLTGTPIQNRLEDIGSLLAFLRVNPFHSLATFRKHIALPFDEGGKRRQLAVERFTRLLDSLCLRRTTDLLQLPEQHNRVRNIPLSPEERAQYEQTRNTMVRAVRNQVGILDQKNTMGMFQIQLQLRIICNHGTWQQPFSWSRRKLYLLDEREAKDAYFGKDAEATCSACRETMPLFNTGSMFQQYTEHCRHIICLECLGESMPNGQESFPKDCPLCTSLWAATSQNHPSKQTFQEDTYFRAEGRSSKLEALMRDVMLDVSTTKSIIFTCWTRTLDLLELYLKQASLDSRNFKRIDGECPTAKREAILHEFATSPQLHILIMTTGTGAVGQVVPKRYTFSSLVTLGSLNLATANRVFIVEPQYNPSVENQAIARALRLGQKQAVLVTRYVVDQTMEQEMRTLQDRKLERANLVKSGS